MSEVNRAHATVAALVRHAEPDDPRIADARAQLEAAKTEAYVERIVADAPPLSPEQKLRIIAAIGGAS